MLFSKKLYGSVLLIIKYEYKRLFLKSIFFNTLLAFMYRMKAFRYLIALNRRTCLSYLRLRCILTLRTRSLLVLFKLSRLSFRYLYAQGALIGVRKGSR